MKINFNDLNTRFYISKEEAKTLCPGENFDDYQCVAINLGQMYFNSLTIDEKICRQQTSCYFCCLKEDFYEAHMRTYIIISLIMKKIEKHL